MSEENIVKKDQLKLIGLKIVQKSSGNQKKNVFISNIIIKNNKD